MYSEALKDLKNNLDYKSLSSLAEKHHVSKARLEKYFYHLHQIKTEHKGLTWSNTEKNFLKMFISDAKNEFQKRSELYRNAASFLEGRSGDSVRLIYNRKIRENLAPVKLANTKIIESKEINFPKYDRNLAEEFLKALSNLVSSYTNKDDEFESIKKEVSELAMQVVQLDEKQKKLSKVLKTAKKLEKTTSQRNNEVLKKTKTILNYKQFGGVVEVEKA